MTILDRVPNGSQKQRRVLAISSPDAPGTAGLEPFFPRTRYRAEGQASGGRWPATPCPATRHPPRPVLESDFPPSANAVLPAASPLPGASSRGTGRPSNVSTSRVAMSATGWPRRRSERLAAIDRRSVLEVRTLHSSHCEIGDAICGGELQHPTCRECIARRCRFGFVDKACAGGRSAEFHAHSDGYGCRICALHAVIAHHAPDPHGALPAQSPGSGEDRSPRSTRSSRGSSVLQTSRTSRSSACRPAKHTS